LKGLFSLQGDLHAGNAEIPKAIQAHSTVQSTKLARYHIQTENDHGKRGVLARPLCDVRVLSVTLTTEQKNRLFCALIRDL
jgi:hypothetical protein